MRTTTSGVLWEVLAPVVRWPLYSPVRFGVVLATILGALFVVGGVTGGEEENPTGGVSISGADDPSSADPSSIPSDVPKESADPGTRRTVKELAHRFVRIYLDATVPRDKWLSRLSKLTTPDLASALETVDQANVHAGTRVVAVDVRGVGSTAASAVVVTDLTEVTVDLAHSGQRWEVTRILPSEPEAEEDTEENV